MVLGENQNITETQGDTSSALEGALHGLLYLPFTPKIRKGKGFWSIQCEKSYRYNVKIHQLMKPYAYRVASLGKRKNEIP